MSPQADLRGVDLRKDRWGTSLEVIYRSSSLGRITVGMPGEHNVLNALAATAVGLELDLEIGGHQRRTQGLRWAFKTLPAQGRKEWRLIPR